MNSNAGYVLYSPHTPLGKFQGLGNHLYIFYTTYSHCIDNGIEMRIDEDAHPVMKNILLQKQKRLCESYYKIEHLSDLKANGIPFQLHANAGSSDTNGFDFSIYRHNIPKIRHIMNVPNEPIDVCVMHIRVYTTGPQFNVGLPFYMNALKHIKSKRIIVMSGYSNYDIKEDITKKNIDYLISKLSVIYPDKEFIDIRTIPEYLDENDDIEAMKHWYLCVNCKELIAPPSTFSLSAAMLRGDHLTITPKHQNLYGATYDLRDVASNVKYITRNIIVSAWYDVDDDPNSRAKRLNTITTFFERINNADIIIFTDNQALFKELNIDWLSHIRIIHLPIESLYGCQFKEFIERCLMINSGMRSRGASWKMVAVWYSKIWLVFQASFFVNRLYDKLAWIDIGIYKNNTIEQRDIFPVFEKHMLNRSLWYSLNIFHSTLHYLFDGPPEGGFQLSPNHDHVQLAYILFDMILKECINANILGGSDEEIMRLMLSLTGDFLMIGIDKSLGQYGWCRFIHDFSDSIQDFVKTIYPDIPKQKPDVDILYLKKWTERHKQPINWDHTRDVW